MAWINVKERLPEKPGYYEIKNNSPSCNNGRGQVEWNGEKWEIPEIIKSFFTIYYWWEN